MALQGWTGALADTPGWDVSPSLGWRSRLWSETPKTFLAQAAPHGYRWSSGRNRAWSDQPIRFGELVARTSEVEFHRDTPVRWNWIVHDKGFHGGVSAAWAGEQLRIATNTLQRWTDGEAMEMASPPGTRTLAWGRPPHIASVHWNDAGDGGDAEAAGFLRVTVEPWPPRRDWRANVREDEHGDRVLDGVPMVDQMTQGNCAPATVERVMRYYGIPLGASALGRLAESSADAGTNVERMLSKIGSLHGMRCVVREILGFDVPRFDRTIRAYNREAARAGRPFLRWQPPVLDLARVFAGADPAALRKATEGQPGKARFWREVGASIESGHPLVWGVILGIVPEEGIARSTSGGHLRLIVGYNARRREILYSDSWGPGHECKRMPLDDAWAATISLHAIAPPSVF